MSITDPWTVQPWESRGTFTLMRGREAMYDEADRMMEWDSEAEAEAFRDAAIPAQPRRAAGQMSFELGKADG
jgi:hypothetical protein